MRYAKIEKMSISNGPGIRISLFTQGCPIHCPNCFNSEIWDFDGGKEFDLEKDFETIRQLADHDYIAGLSILGGEPLVEQNLGPLYALIVSYAIAFPDQTIWIWTGYTWEELQQKYKDNIYFQLILFRSDVLVDGPFIEAKKDPSLAWKGSSNQRVIDIHKTLKENKIVLWE